MNTQWKIVWWWAGYRRTSIRSMALDHRTMNYNFITCITDGGRKASSFPSETLDCTVRALALAGSMDYDKAHAIMESLGRKPRRGHRGYNGKMAKLTGSRCVKRSGSLGKFVATHPEGSYLVSIKSHVTAVIDGHVFDSCPPSPHSRVEKASRMS